jgi:hypothetical protein
VAVATLDDGLDDDLDDGRAVGAPIRDQMPWRCGKTEIAPATHAELLTPARLLCI